MYTAPGDYTNVLSEALTFTRTDTSETVTVTINDDNVVENLMESFTANLMVNAALNPGVSLDPESATINIMDDDG